MARKSKPATIAIEPNAVHHTAATDKQTTVAGGPKTNRRKRKSPVLKIGIVPEPVNDASATPSSEVDNVKPIAGKLGTIANAVTRRDGASLNELTEATGWQPHTVRAALTRLRQRGIAVRLATVDDRKAYRVDPTEA